MKTYIEEKTWTRVVDKVFCDRCQKELSPYGNRDTYSLEIENQWSDGYDDYGSSKNLDICSRCVTDHVIPALISAGLPIHIHGEDKFFWVISPENRRDGKYGCECDGKVEVKEGE